MRERWEGNFINWVEKCVLNKRAYPNMGYLYVFQKGSVREREREIWWDIWIRLKIEFYI